MRKFVFFVMLAICSVNMYGQELSDAEAQNKKKEINSIKLSEEAVYADVVELALDDSESVSLAQQKSIQMLQTHVIEIFAKRMNMSKADVQEIWDVIDDKCQNIVVRKGDLCRVFTYIMKDAIGFGRKKPDPKYEDWVKPTDGKGKEVNADSKKKEEKTEEAAIEEKAQEIANAMTGGKDSINTVVEKKAEVIEKKEEVAEKVTETVEKKEEATQTTVVAEEKVVEDAKPKVVDVPVVEEKKPEVKVETPEVNVPTLCQEIIEQGTFNKLTVYLGKKKAENKLMFGNPNQMQYVERCYVVLFEKKSRNIVTVLDKGEGDRMNFVTKQMDHLKNYKNGQYGAIYVQEF